MYDSRGVDLNRMREGLEEISSWMSDGVRHYLDDRLTNHHILI